MDSTAEVFLLTRDARDTPRGLELVLWASGPDGPVRAVLRDQEAVCFVARASASPPGVRRREVALATLDGTPSTPSTSAPGGRSKHFGSVRNRRSTSPTCDPPTGS